MAITTMRPAMPGRTTPPQEDRTTWLAFLFFMVAVAVAIFGGLISLLFV